MVWGRDGFFFVSVECKLPKGIRLNRYRKVHVKIWNDEKFLKFTDDGKLAFLFLLTHPHMTSLGAMRASSAGLAAELGWTSERMHSALKPAVADRMIVMDPDSSFCWLPKFLDYNQPESPNVVRSWATQAELVPECSFTEGMIRAIESKVKALGEGFGKAFDEAFAKGYPHTSPNPEPKPLPEPLKSKALGTEVPIPPSKGFQRPTLVEVSDYIREKGFKVDPEKWFDHYTSNGWKVGRNSMKDWRAAVRTWAKGSGFMNGKTVPAVPAIPRGRDVLKRLESL